MSAQPTSIKIEEKLYQNRYMVDEGRPHISIKNRQTCLSCPDRACVAVCPARCYSDADDGTVDLATDGCLECGTCRVICQDMDNIDWWYPRGGYGILFKFG